ncbi:MAG: alpha-mannosidase [Thermomicrobiales bacterium]|nr:alpha-mannosidase [Thermomicrobiales bacterium]
MPTPFTERRLERVLRRLEELRAWRNARESAIPDWQFIGSDGHSRPIKLKDFWPVVETPVRMTSEGRIPAEWAGQPVELELWLGGEGFVRLSTGLQAGLNPMHHRFPVFEQAIGGETISIEAELVPKGIFGSNIPEPRVERAHFVIPQREVRALERDLTMLYEASLQLGDHEVVPFLLDVAEAALSELAAGWPSATDIAVSRYVLGYDNGLGSGVAAVPEDWVPEAIDARRPTQPTWSLPPAPRPMEPLPQAAVDAVNRARAVYAEGIERVKHDYPPVGRLCLTGHAHIDLAWLWPLAETRRKTRRTFSTVLSLMERYPDFTFNQSSAQAYAWIEEDDPALFARIKERVAEGRWEPTGGMWLESDCNVTGGEAFVRHLLYGQRYFERTFGKRHSVAWLPDVFGFSGAIPQLLRGAGIDGFFTIKLYWNESNLFPYDLFAWEGIDGSQVTAHMFLNPGHGYNGNLVPLDTLGTWRNFRGKRLHPESILAFGWGDGAGGPSEKMLENYARIKDFPVLPRLRMGRIDELFAAFPPEDQLPRYVGELYFELHRGTLTSQATTKALNRASEHRLLEAEAFGTIAALDGFTYPRDDIETAWKTLLLNQFHDILPGSSINEVYQDTHRLLADVVATSTRARDDALAHLAGGADVGPRVLIANAGLSPRPLRVTLPAQSATESVVTADGIALPTQATDDGLLVGDPQRRVPGLGWAVLDLVDDTSDQPQSITSGVTAEATTDLTVLENELLRVEIGADGTIARLLDKSAGREVLADRGNQLWAYLDKPRAWDAWDVDETYERNGEEIGGVEAVEAVESGPVRASARVSRTWRGSRIVQTYRLWAGSTRLDIETYVDWHERQILLKARFPLAIRTHEATFETMYGVVRRPTHRNTSLAAAQFEGSGHRFADLSEPGYGVALLNDGKYGHGVHENVLTLSLLRGPLYPDPLADEGEHRFTYSLLPHTGDWTDSTVVQEAFALNSPLIPVPAGADTAASASGLLETEGVPLALGSLKRADDGDGVILRLYEPHGRRGTTTLRFSRPLQTAERVNLLEEPAEGSQPLEIGVDHSLSLSVRPFEVISLRLQLT